MFDALIELARARPQQAAKILLSWLDESSEPRWVKLYKQAVEKDRLIGPDSREHRDSVLAEMQKAKHQQIQRNKAFRAVLLAMRPRRRERIIKALIKIGLGDDYYGPEVNKHLRVVSARSNMGF